LYVGRSNGIRKLGIGRATYRKGQARSGMANQELFAKEFAAAKLRIRSMQVRYVEEKDPIRIEGRRHIA
jgi:hypothetical protein